MEFGPSDGVLDITYHTINVTSFNERGQFIMIQEDTSVSITTPSALIKELFTHGGAGTMVRQGETIHKLTNKADLDETRTVSLIEAAFDQKVHDNWWTELDLLTAYMSDSYRAAALLTEIDGFVYLDKFAIHESARGEGLARTVWSQLEADFPSFYWRSRRDNTVNAFYLEEADGFANQGPWKVFWKGNDDFDDIARVVKRLSDMPSSFEKSPDDA